METKKDISHYIQVYDQAVSPEICRKLIQDSDDMAAGKDPEHNEEWRRCHALSIGIDNLEYKELKNVLVSLIQRYQIEVKEDNLYHVGSIEIPQVFCYKTRGNDNGKKHSFHRHADAWSISTASRQVSLILYLNDVPEGGETIFPEIPKNVKPAEGKVLLFPSNFLYPHYGAEPISNNKYVLVAWFHFGKSGQQMTTVSL